MTSIELDFNYGIIDDLVIDIPLNLKSQTVLNSGNIRTTQGQVDKLEVVLLEDFGTTGLTITSDTASANATTITDFEDFDYIDLYFGISHASSKWFRIRKEETSIVNAQEAGLNISSSITAGAIFYNNNGILKGFNSYTRVVNTTTLTAVPNEVFIVYGGRY